MNIIHVNAIQKEKLGGTTMKKEKKGKTVKEVVDEIYNIFKKEHLTASQAWKLLNAVRCKIEENAGNKPL